jgi:hypothetical protein
MHAAKGKAERAVKAMRIVNLLIGESSASVPDEFLN